MNKWSITRNYHNGACMPDCPDRTAECHITCERYAELRRMLDERNAKQRAERERQYKGRHPFFYHIDKDKE